MIFPKHSRQRIFHAGVTMRAVEVPWPEGEPNVGHRYVVERRDGGVRRSSEVKVRVVAVREDAGQWWATVKIDADTPRLLGRHGGYVTSPQGAIRTRERGDTTIQFRAAMEPEAVDKDTQDRFDAEGRARHQGRVTEDFGPVFAAMNLLRQSIDGLDEVGQRRVSRTVFQLRAKLDSAERELRRRLAA